MIKDSLVLTISLFLLQFVIEEVDKQSCLCFMNRN